MIAQESRDWIGQKVVAKYHYPIKSEDSLVECQSRFHVYTVEREEGDNLWVASGRVKGWIPASQAVLFHKVIAFYTQEIAADPVNSEVWRERGIIWILKEEYDKAITDLNETIRLAPEDAIAYDARGIAWLLKEAYEKAIADYNEATALNSKPGGAYENRAIAWRVKEEYDRAIFDFDESIRLDPDNALTYSFRGLTWSEKRGCDKAIADFNEAIRLDPSKALYYSHRGWAWGKKQDYQKAIAEYDKAIRLDPKSAATYIQRGYAWFIKGTYDKAIADFTEAIRLDPQAKRAYWYRGNVRLVNNEHVKAIADYDEAIRLDPTNAHLYTARGWASQNRNDFAKALGDYHEAIRLDSEDVVAVHNRNWLLATFRIGDRREDHNTSGGPQAIRHNRNIGTSKSISRALIAFHIRCWQKILAPVLCLVPLFIMNLLRQVSLVPILVIIVAICCLRFFVDWYYDRKWGSSFWPWRLSRRVVGFCTIASDRVSLLFPASLDEVLDLAEFIRCSELDLDDLSQRFGKLVTRRLTVVLVPSHRDLTEDFGRPMGGIALTHANAVVLAADCPLREGLRHELTHLFAVQWNGFAPPLVQEGLAMWLQSTTADQKNTPDDVDSVLPFDTDPLLMLDPRHFFAPDRLHVSYALAGAFTDFLIRHFGWDHYRRFYNDAYRWRFPSCFQGHFGMSFEQAWRWCHDDHVEMARVGRQNRVERNLHNFLS